MRILLLVLSGLGLLCSNTFALDNKPLTTSRSQTNMQSIPELNKAKGDDFLATNKKKSRVITLADGLQYKILVDGKGPKPTINDTVEVNYAGTLINGTEFDSSYKRGTPAVFPLRGVIPGWTETLQLMKVGSTWEIYIPANLAYGTRGAPPVIGPNETLIFKVELLSIKK